MKETLYMFTRKSQIHQILYRRSEAVPEPLIAPLITDFADCTLSGNRKRARAIDWAVIQVTLVQYVIPYLRKGSVSHIGIGRRLTTTLKSVISFRKNIYIRACCTNIQQLDNCRTVAARHIFRHRAHMSTLNC